jgi:hypothetical protein
MLRMNGKRGFSIRIFLPDGTPDGVRIVEKSNWTGCGLVCPRPLLGTAKSRQEFNRTGVYVLVGPPEESELPRVYIGEGDPVRPRLEQHLAKKDFWTTAIIFSSKDGNLNKAHVQHLEARLLKLATEAKRCEIDNSNQSQLPSLSEADAAEVEGFLDEMLLCFPVLGVTVFEKPVASISTALKFSLKARGVSGTGYESAQGFVVNASSEAAKEEVPSIHRYLSDLRKGLINKGILQDTGPVYRFTQDYLFNSPSTAAGVLIGRSANGRELWKTDGGRSLKQIQEAEARIEPANS